MHDLATISRIDDIHPIEGKDRIVLATVENYHSIINKEDFKVGDKVIYVYYDSILPVRPEFEFLRKRCYSEKYHGFRIRPMKMGGEISEGLVLPLSLIDGAESLPIGEVVTDRLAIRRYDPEENAPPIVNNNKKWWLKFKIVRKIYKALGIGAKKKIGYPDRIPKADEENIEKCWESVKGSIATFIVTEKMEGCAAMYTLDKRKKLHIYSHNWEVGSDGAWGEMAKSLDIEKGLKSVLKKTKRRVAIEGEICGPSIQKNIYKFPSYRFFLYSAYDADTGNRLFYKELEEIAKIMRIEMVPFIKRSSILSSVDEMLKDAEGDSVFGPMREGLVWRTEDGSVHFKCKSRPYKLWFS